MIGISGIRLWDQELLGEALLERVLGRQKHMEVRKAGLVRGQRWLSCSAVTVAASADPLELSGAWMALQSCPKLRQGGWISVSCTSQSSVLGCPQKVMYSRARQFLAAKDISQRGKQLQPLASIIPRSKGVGALTLGSTSVVSATHAITFTFMRSTL